MAIIQLKLVLAWTMVMSRLTDMTSDMKNCLHLILLYETFEKPTLKREMKHMYIYILKVLRASATDFLTYRV